MMRMTSRIPSASLRPRFLALSLCLVTSSLGLAQPCVRNKAAVAQEDAFTASRAGELLKLLEFGNLEQKLEATVLLRQSAPSILPEVERLLHANDPDTVRGACDLMLHLRWKPDRALREQIGDLMDDFQSKAPGDRGWAAVAGMTSIRRFMHGHAAQPVLDPDGTCKRLQDGSRIYKQERWMTVESLVAILRDQSVPFLVRMIQDPYCGDVMCCAWDGMLRFARPADLPAILREMDRPNAVFRREAFFCLVRVDPRLALERALGELDLDPRSATALAVLRELTFPGGLPRSELDRGARQYRVILSQITDAADTSVQMVSAGVVRNLTLQGILGVEALPPLETFLRNPANRHGRNDVELALVQLGSPLVLDHFLDVPAALAEYAADFGVEPMDKMLEQVILDYLRSQPDPRAAEAIKKYEESLRD